MVEFAIDPISLIYLALIIVAAIAIVYYWGELKAWFGDLVPSLGDVGSGAAKVYDTVVADPVKKVAEARTNALTSAIDRIPLLNLLPDGMKRGLVQILPGGAEMDLVRGVTDGSIISAAGRLASGDLGAITDAPGVKNLTGSLPGVPPGIIPDGLLSAGGFAQLPGGLFQQGVSVFRNGAVVGTIDPSGVIKSLAGNPIGSVLNGKLNALPGSALASIPGASIATKLPGAGPAIAAANEAISAIQNAGSYVGGAVGSVAGTVGGVAGTVGGVAGTVGGTIGGAIGSLF